MNAENIGIYLDRYKRTFLIVIICLSILELLTLLLWWKERYAKDEKIYVMTDMGTFMVSRNQLNIRQSWEIKNHSKIVLQNLFENDVYTYRNNLENGLQLMDNQIGLKVRDMMDKSGLYELLRKENAYTKIIFDSIVLTKGSQPYQIRAYFKQMVMWRGLNQLIPYGVILSVTEDSRSSKNPYGLLVHALDLFKYSPDNLNTALPTDSLKGFR